MSWLIDCGTWPLLAVIVAISAATPAARADPAGMTMPTRPSTGTAARGQVEHGLDHVPGRRPRQVGLEFVLRLL